METVRLKLLTDIFRRLTPANQRCFMMMVSVAETAERNARNAMESGGTAGKPEEEEIPEGKIQQEEGCV